MSFFYFITSQQGAQYTYLGMAVINALLVFDIHMIRWLAKPPRNIIIESNVTLYTIAHLFKMAAFLFATAITGAHPRYAVVTIAPYYRLAWFVVLIFLAPSVLNGTWKIFAALWHNAHRGSHV